MTGTTARQINISSGGSGEPPPSILWYASSMHSPIKPNSTTGVSRNHTESRNASSAANAIAMNKPTASFGERRTGRLASNATVSAAARKDGDQPSNSHRDERHGRTDGEAQGGVPLRAVLRHRR